MDTTFWKTILLGMVMFSFSVDAKGIRVGGFKVPKPKVPSLSVPRPHVPLIVPVVIPVGGFHSHGGNSYNRKNGRLQCYTCEGSNNDLCAVNPAAASKKTTCPQNHYCSVIRKEVPEGIYNTSKLAVKANQTDSAMLNSSVIASTIEIDPLSFLNVSSTMSPDEVRSSSTVVSTQGDIDTSTPSSFASVSLSDDNSTSLTRNTREATRIIIQRGCKSVDFLEGSMLFSSKSNGNDSEKVFAQLCSTDLCNIGDGRLRCYKCKGTGVNHDCMVKPSTVSEIVMCQMKESCYVERKTVTFNSTSTINSTDVTKVMVSRGCRAASSSDDSNVISRTKDTLGMSCRLNDYCNAFDANKLVRSNSATVKSATLATLVLTVLVTLIL